MYTLATMGLFEYIQDAFIAWASYQPAFTVQESRRYLASCL